MRIEPSRRSFLRAATFGGAITTLGDLGFLAQLPRAEAAEGGSRVVRLSDDIEPIVQLIEQTPREELLGKIADKIKKGLSYRDLLAGLMLAGVRNIQPRPSVGFKFHAVLVVNAAHLASLSSPQEHRWLPIFWALDNFKSSQARDVREGNWTMEPVDEKAVPTSGKARGDFIHAMETWDVEAADVAIAGLVRTAGASEVFELLYRYGARDFRSIGHKAIFVANSWRTLQCIGWRHAEPILRSLAYALLNHGDGPNPAKSDLDADRPGRTNAQLVKKIRADWKDGKHDDGATREMLAVLRQATNSEACSKAVELINSGIHPQSIWDAIMVGAGELVVRQPGIVALHAVTTSNALRFAFGACGDDAARRTMLLQNVAFLPMFREAMKGRGKMIDFKLDSLKAGDKLDVSIEQIFRDVSGDRMAAARGMLARLSSGGDAKELIDAARVLIFMKGRDAHDYKFSSAVLEDYYKISPSWRNQFLASSLFKLRGSGDSDTQLVKRTRDALRS